MPKALQILLLLVLLQVCFAGVVSAQSQAGDCVNALPICEPSYSQTESVSGPGNLSDEINAASSCLETGERNGVWYRFEVDATGLISFLISPIRNNVDYDWAVYDLTNARCSDIFDNPALEISCNYSQQGGPTGATGASALTSQSAIGNRFNARIPVQAGGTYYLYVSSFTPNAGGYNIQFNNPTSFPDEPDITDTRPPVPIRVEAPNLCLRDTLNVYFNEYVDCRSVQESDFRLILPDGQALEALSIYIPDCDEIPENLTQRVRIQWAKPYTQIGIYKLQIVAPVSDACGNELQTYIFPFDQNFLPLSVTASVVGGGQSIYCGSRRGLRLLAQADGVTYEDIEYYWAPDEGLDDPLQQSPFAFPKATTQYTVFARVGTCNSIPDSLQVTVLPKPQNRISGPGTACAGQEVSWSITGAEDYLWLNSGTSGPTFTGQFPAGDSVLKVLPLIQGCQSDTLFIPVRVLATPDPMFDFSRNTLCVFQTLTLRDTNAQSGWRYLWQAPDAIRGGGSLPDNLSLYYTETGTRQIEVQAIAEGCTSQVDRRTVRVDPIPQVIPPAKQVWCRPEAAPVLRPNILPERGCAYLWEPADGLDNPTFLNPTATPEQTTTYTLRVLCGDCDAPPVTTTVVVEEVPAPRFDVPEVFFCEGTTGVQLIAQVPGGNFQYIWEPTTGLDKPYSAQPTAAPDNTTVYTLRLIGPQGCVGPPAAIRVRPAPNPVALAGKDMSYCRGAFGPTLTGQVESQPLGESYRYRWTPQDGLSEPNERTTLAQPDSSALYRLEVEAIETGCRSQSVDDQSAVWVRVQELPIAFAGPDTSICQGDSLRIGEKPAGGSGGFLFEWYPKTQLINADSDTNLPIFVAQQSQTYVLRVISGDCISLPDSIHINVRRRPQLELEGNDVWICPRDSARLSLRSSLLDSVRIVWQPAASLSDPKSTVTWAFPDTTTTYTVVGERLGCTSRDELEISVNVRKLPALDADTENEPNQRYYCPDQSLVIPAAFGPTDLPTRYIWSPSTGLSRTDILNPLAQPESTEKYTLQVDWEGCTLVDSIEIIVGPRIGVEVKADTHIVCAGRPMKLTATGGVGSATFYWLPEETEGVKFETKANQAPNQTFVYLEKSGRVGVEAREAHCADTAWIDLQVLPQPIADFEAAPDPACRPFVVSFFNRSTDFSFSQWDFDDNSGPSSTTPINQRDPEWQYPDTGSYIVRLIVRAEGGCADTLTRPIPVRIHELPEAEIVLETENPHHLPEAWLRASSRYVNAGTMDWLWEFGDGNVGRGRQVSYRYAKAGTYVLILTVLDSSGCMARDTVSVEVTDGRPPTDNVFTPNGDGINDDWGYPWGAYSRYRLQIFDRWGQLVFSTDDINTRWNGTLLNNGNDVPAGTYFYVLEVDQQQRTGTALLMR